MFERAISLVYRTNDGCQVVHRVINVIRNTEVEYVIKGDNSLHVDIVPEHNLIGRVLSVNRLNGNVIDLSSLSAVRIQRLTRLSQMIGTVVRIGIRIGRGFDRLFRLGMRERLGYVIGHLLAAPVKLAYCVMLPPQLAAQSLCCVFLEPWRTPAREISAEASRKTMDNGTLS